ncbi:MAG: GtrA family protein [Bacteroidia bacterium]
MTFFQFIKFGLIGTTGLTLDFSITWFCKEKLKINKYVANGLGFTVAVVNNYFLNKHFTFEDTNTHIGEQFTRFAMVSIIGFLLNTGLIFFLQKNTKTNFYVSKAIVTVLVFFWNFFANSLYTFN